MVDVSVGVGEAIGLGVGVSPVLWLEVKLMVLMFELVFVLLS